MVAAYFDLDVEVWVEVDELAENRSAEVDELGGGVYTIHLDKYWIKDAIRDELITVIAHEMVHVKQYEQDGLDLTVVGSYMNGKEWKGDYWFSPWEIEARGYEQAFLHYFTTWTK